MEEKHDVKTGRPILLIIGASLLALFNSAISQSHVQQIRRALQPSVALATAIVAAVNPLSDINLTAFGNDACDTQPNRPMSRVHFFRREHIDYESGLNYTSNTSEAVCLYDETQPSHFPHAMQQLFGCFSFWNVHSTKKPILAVDHKSLKKLNKQQFTRDFLQMLHAQLTMQISKFPNMTTFKTLQNSTTEMPFLFNSRGWDVTPFKKLNEYMAAYFQLKDTSSDACSNSKPRIGILNRANYSGRSILNADQIAVVANGLSRDNHIPVQYFESHEFVDQVTFFRSVDILISPHGAQLTGLAFMDAPCAHLFELFPKGYGIPYYFGNLADNTGKRHSYMYMSEGSFLTEQAKDKGARKATRSANMCPSMPAFVGYLQELVADWKECCTSLATGAVDVGAVGYVDR